MQNNNIELELSFSDLVQLVRKEYSNERDNIGYARAAKIVDNAIAAHFTERERNARLIELELLEQALNDGRDLNRYKLYRLDSLDKGKS